MKALSIRALLILGFLLFGSNSLAEDKKKGLSASVGFIVEVSAERTT